MDIISKTLHYLGQNKKDLFVVQIGAMDGISFDDTRYFLDLYKWDALLVEPIPDIFNELKENFKDRDNYIFEQSAIANYDGEITMLTVSNKTIQEEGLHEGYKGMSAVYPLKNGFGSTYQRDVDVKANFGTNINVPCLTLDSLCKKHDINQIDIFICDAEGSDFEIFKQIDFTKYRPSFIRLEYTNLTDIEKEQVVKMLEENGYTYTVTEDIDAVDTKLWEYEINDMHPLYKYIEKYGTDKIESGYCNYYEQLFAIVRDKVRHVLEVGIGSFDNTVESNFCGVAQKHPQYKPGGSLRVWRDYFKNAKIYGIDIAEDCNFIENRIQTFIFDSRNKFECDKNLHNLKFDIIIDDGLHIADAQIDTITNLFGKLKVGGLYIIEDVGGSGDPVKLMIDRKKEIDEFLNIHEYYYGGNVLFIRKTNSNIGSIESFNTFLNKKHTQDGVVENFNKYVNDLSVSDKSLLFEYFKTLPKINVINTELTVVTGLWNIGRTGRSFDHYIEHFKKFLEIPNYMLIFIPVEYEHLIWEVRDRVNTSVKIYELSDIKNIYAPFWDRTQKIRTDEEWYNLTGENGWLKDSPQATLEWYNPIVMSKMFMLHDATIWNPFNTELFIWLDAGITNTVYENYFIQDRVLDKINPFLDTFLFLSYPYDANDEIHGFKIDDMNRLSKDKVKYVCRGGLFGGTREYIHEANSDYYHLVETTLSNGLMGTEESIFTIMSYLKPDVYRRYSLDDNGLIVKFTESLVDDNVKLVPIRDNRPKLKIQNPNLSKTKTSLYMLTFNFPEQIEHTLETWEKNSPDWLKKPRKILIDNSTNKEARIGNKVIADKWGFEHIIREENTGINGGRLFAAEHFNDSDSDFYFFFEDDMGLNYFTDLGFCRNGFRKFIPNLYDIVHKIMIKEDFDFLKLSYTEVFMDNNIQVSWYNIPKDLRTKLWPHYDQLPVAGLDQNSPRTKFNTIDVFDGVSYITGDIYYANWPMIVSREGNRKMFLETKWEHPYEQTWMSYMFQETINGNLNPAVLLASPVCHDRIKYYEPEERREN
jgi:FkbM family methyltransferase